MPPLERDPRAAARALVKWYRRHGRDLPWRREAGPYEVLVSEIMLQQTTVDAVIPYYGRFLAAFPDFAALAAAGEEDVLKLWSGLGYYSRARNLLAAARAVAGEHGGRLPAGHAELRSLPGIGPYTAAAIRAIAFGEAAVALDGNLKRVLARLIGYGEETGTAAAAEALEEAGLAIVKAGDPSAINQALMDLGATICAPRAPRCLLCPLAPWCAARLEGRQEEIPKPAKRAGSVEVHLGAGILSRRGKVLLRRRTARLMRGMWEVPLVSLGASPTRGRERAASEIVVKRLSHELGVEIEALAPAGTIRHSITNHRIRVHLFRGTASGGRRPAPGAVSETASAYGALEGGSGGEVRWVPPDSFGDLPVTGITRKIMKAARLEAGGERRAGA